MLEVDLMIFDLDGTLADTGEDIAGAVNHARSKAGLDSLGTREILKYVGGGLRVTLLEAMGNGAAPSEEMLRAFLDYYESHILDKTVLYPHVKQVLEKYRNKKKAVVSNKHEKYCREILEGLGIAGYFQLILGSDSVQKPKPAAFPLIKVMNDLKVSPERSIMIGDGFNDIMAARAAGVDCCAVGYGFGERNELLSHAPAYFIDDMEDLLKIVK
jgi:phosphoglycolate phosphatase